MKSSTLKIFHRVLGKTQSFCLVVLSGASEEVIGLPCSAEESSGATCRPPLQEALTVLTEPYGTRGELETPGWYPYEAATGVVEDNLQLEGRC
jgi:hypothetical protein